MPNTKPSDYSALDAALLASICGGLRHATHLYAAHEQLAKPHCISWRGVSPPPPWRVVERRLQALRKSGKIIHQHPGGWTVCAQ